VDALSRHRHSKEAFSSRQGAHSALFASHIYIFSKRTSAQQLSPSEKIKHNSGAK